MSEQIQLLGVLAGLAVLAVSVGLALRVERGRLETRLRAFVGTRSIRARLVGAELPDVASLARRDARHPILRWTRLGVQTRQLAQAGWSMSPRRFLLLQLLGGLLGFVLARLVSGRLGYQGVELVALVAAGPLAGLAMPRLLLRLATRRRSGRVETQLPIALDSIANGIQAGLSMPQSLDVVSRDMPAPLGTELKVVIREIGLGLGLEEALGNLADRVQLKEIEIFVAAIHIQFRTGGNLSGILRTLANTVRERLRIRGEVRTLTGQAKLSSYIVTVLPIGIAVAIKFINPMYFEKLLEPGAMRIMLVVAVMGIVSGFYVMMRIANIEV
jgi:tight adherence protein B